MKVDVRSFCDSDRSVSLIVLIVLSQWSMVAWREIAGDVAKLYGR